MEMPNSGLVSACGLYCGACHKYSKGSCPGCRENDKATWCKVRICTKERGLTTCAACHEYADVDDCGKLNNIFAKFFALVFRSDRKASLRRIAEIGIDAYAAEMHEKHMVVIKRK
jgi:hypothetical protein